MKTVDPPRAEFLSERSDSQTEATRPEPAESAADRSGPIGIGILRGARVLIVDDEPDARELLVELLTPCQASVVVASNASEALQAVLETRPDAVISDIGMPDEDGYALLRSIRSLPPERGGNVPAMALTAFGRSEDKERAYRAGFDLHLTKPISPKELCAALANLLFEAPTERMAG